MLKKYFKAMKIKHANNKETNSIRSFNFMEGNTAPLQNNGQFQFARQHSLNIYKKNAIYTFIPKNGCTSLRASLAVDNGFLTEPQIQNQINWVHNNSYTYSANIRELINAEYTFTILRCPYERLASLFLDKFVDKSPIAWTFYRLSNNKFDPDDLTFELFINYLIDNPSSLNGEIHWRKQTDFLVYKRYDDYFNFSNFTDITQTLSKKLNLKIIDTRNITNHGREKYEKINDQCFSQTPVKELHDMKFLNKLPTSESLFNDNLKEKVKRIYHKDFELFKKIKKDL